MKTSFVLPAMCLTVLALLVTGCISSPPSSPGGAVPPVLPTGETPVAETTPAPTIPPVCEFTSCHGLDLQCGPNPPQVCTAVYQLGDKCRQYAFCSKTSTTCQLVTTPQFETCRRCIEKCGGADSAEILLCEEKC